MTAFALMCQTLRVDECTAFLRQESRRWIVVVGDQHEIGEDDLPHQSELVMMVSPIAGAGRFSGSNLRRSAISWMRGGSRIGRMAETGLRRIKGLTSPARRRYDPMDRSVTPTSGWLDFHTDDVLAFLEARHELETVSEIVVFDLFDLPAALAFADRHGVPVSVR